MPRIALSVALTAIAAAIFAPRVIRMTYRSWRYGHLAPLFERGGE
ncbi:MULTISPECIES: hypothetical protein [Rhizobium/Agrobacterium group]|nr:MULTISPECIES: hypothetical protein [Rhizobium/Agrobacterium group]TCR67849.1 hypothetical protein EV561_1497 [Rhizobium sp. BK376]